MNILVTKLLGFAEIFIFFTPAPVISVLEDIDIVQHHHRYDVMYLHV